MLMVLVLALFGVATPAREGEDHTAAETFAKAEQLRKNGDEDSARKAIESYKEAISYWHKDANRTEEARSLARIGDVYRSFHALNDALAYYNQALALYRNLKDRRGECQTQNQITTVYVSLGENSRARNSNRAAARLARLTADRTLMAQALNNEGEIYYWSGEQKKAIDLYQRALRLWIEAKDLQGQAETYTYLGYSTSDLALVKESFDYYRRALELWQAIPDRHGEAITFTGLGRLYSRVGESQEALDYLDKANAFLSRSPNPVEKARVLTAFAFVYGRVGEKQKAIDYYQRALALYKSAGYLKGQAATLYSAGKVYYSLEDHQKALDSQREALDLCRKTGDRRIEILALIEIGRLLDFANDKAGAIRNYLLARSFAQSRNDQRTEMDTWSLLGRVYESQGKQRLALDYHKRALLLSRKAKYPFGESETLYRIARMYFALHDLPAARQQIEEAISLIEALRTKVNSQEFRASYFASVRELYELYIDLLMELHAKEPQSGYDVLAFEASERARARSLLEMLATARVGVREKVDPELLARERALRAELSARAEQRLSFQPASGREGERAAVDRELEDLATRYQEVKAQVRAASLDHTEQTQPRSLGLQEIRDRDLAHDTALLEFFLGERRSYLWIVTKNSFKSLSLPPRSEIEDSAIALRKLLIPPTALPGESYDDLQARVREAESEYWRKAAVFSETLLGPVAADLTATRLLIVPDGALQYISFAALPIPARGDDIKPLMLEHEIALQPSASILAMLRGRMEKPAERAIAVFADPVFELNDSRFQAGPGEMVAANTTRDEQMESALRDVNSAWNSGHIPRLLASREEAKAITDLTSSPTNLKAIDFEANKAAFTSLDLNQFRIIHIATHGILDSRHPELSGLLLSRFDKDGRPKEGFLRLDDIYNLSLSAAMVVLSACNTGLGKDVRGEGLVGLVHGFMYAGTSRVVASLWKVDDDATAQLMSHFYREMFQAGKSPAAALRAAQIEMWEQKRWRSPYFWAAFVLHGDYEGRVNDTRRPQRFPWTAAAMAVLVVAAGFFFLKKKLRKKTYVH
jgi:CHAT domain-containing protein/tetratricopeptide (TPR) repeat protein